MVTKNLKYCLDCNCLISRGSKLGRCSKCSKQDKNNSFFGKVHTESTKKKISKANIKDGLPNCIDCDKKLKNYLALRCHSCENKNRYKNPENHPHFGKKFPETSKLKGRKRPDIALRMKGNNHPNFGNRGKEAFGYIDGQSRLPYSKNFTKKLKLEIRTRDVFTCQCCGITEEEHKDQYNRVLAIHHINYDKQNCNEPNLITICNLCNLKANSNRDYWFTYYTYIIEEYIYG